RYHFVTPCTANGGAHHVSANVSLGNTVITQKPRKRKERNRKRPFKRSTVTCGYTEEEDLLRLQKALCGPVLEAVEDLLLLPHSLDEMIRVLETEFGRPEQIIENLIEKMRQMPALRIEKLETMAVFGSAVRKMCVAIRVSDLRTRGTRREALSDNLHGMRAVQTSTLRSNADGVRPLHTPESGVMCRGSCRNLIECHRFLDLTPSDKRAFVRRQEMYRKCLKSQRNECYQRTACRKNGCNGIHHPLLHEENEDTQLSERFDRTMCEFYQLCFTARAKRFEHLRLLIVDSRLPSWITLS
uniref:Uncharacterized protein n=1 Tax=Anopheles stephensi TaxID=30069 RepID=A0A182YRV9_ANOST